MRIRDWSSDVCSSDLTGQSDLDRPLSAEGNAEAEAAGRWLQEQRLVPDLVLCSPSRRTRETLEAVLGQVGYVDQRLEDDIYEASPGALATLVDRPPAVARLRVVGQPPGLDKRGEASGRAKEDKYP